MNRLTNTRIYLKFLSRNKVYTLVSILGFAISLTFVILLGVYIKQELSVDHFHNKKERIFLMASDGKNYASLPIATYVMEQCPEVESFVRVLSVNGAVDVSGQEKVDAKVLITDSTFFTIFDFPLLEGDRGKVLETAGSIVLSKEMAQKLFADGNAIGKSVHIDAADYLVTGIYADFPNNSSIDQPDCILPILSVEQYWGKGVLEATEFANGCVYFLQKEGADLSAKSEMLLALFKEEHPIYMVGLLKTVEFIPLVDTYFYLTGSSVDLIRYNSKTVTYTYLFIALLILIVALLNYINMTVSQTGFRGKEAAIKKLMGSTNREIWLQQFTESLIMLVISYLIALLLAFLIHGYWGEMLKTTIDLGILFSPSVFCFILVAIVLVSFISSIAPARVMARFAPIEVVKGTFRQKVKSSYSKVLIVFQYTVSVALIIVSLFIVEQTQFMVSESTQLDKSQLLSINNTVESTKIPGLKARLQSISGVEHISFTQGVLYGSASISSFKTKDGMFSYFNYAVDTSFFKVYDIQVEPTVAASADNTYWVSESFAQALGMSKENPVYRHIEEHGTERITAAGIFANFRVNPMSYKMAHVGVRKLRESETPNYLTIRLAPNIDVITKAKEIEKAYLDYNGGLPIKLQFLDEMINEMYTNEIRLSTIMTLFTLLTIIITIMGVFAMSLYQVQQKEKEIGIRKVNGATVKQILLMLNLSSIKLVLIGFCIACPIAYFATSRWFEGFADKIHITPWAFLLSLILLCLLTMLSVSVMTWKAARTNPIDILKKD